MSNNLHKAVYTDDIFITADRPMFVYWDGNTKNTPYKSGLTACAEGFAFSYGAWAGYMTVVCFVKNDSTMWIWSKGRNAWVEYAAKSDLQSNLLYKEFTTESRSWKTLECYRLSYTAPNGYKFLTICYTRTNSWIGATYAIPIIGSFDFDIYVSAGSGNGSVTLGALFVKNV